MLLGVTAGCGWFGLNPKLDTVGGGWVGGGERKRGRLGTHALPNGSLSHPDVDARRITRLHKSTQVAPRGAPLNFTLRRRDISQAHLNNVRISGYPERSRAFYTHAAAPLSPGAACLITLNGTSSALCRSLTPLHQPPPSRGLGVGGRGLVVIGFGNPTTKTQLFPMVSGYCTGPACAKRLNQLWMTTPNHRTGSPSTHLPVSSGSVSIMAVFMSHQVSPSSNQNVFSTD